MAYNFEYPYTDPNRYNSDWILSKMKDIEARLDGIVEETVRQTKIYVDEQLEFYQDQVNDVIAQFHELEKLVDDSINAIDDKLLASIEAMDKKVEDVRKEAQTLFIEANARTDTLIRQNNEYIFREIEDNILSNITVINYFTGERTSVQDMFDYLAQFHLENSINYNQLADKNITVSGLIAKRITYTELVKNGKILI